MKREIYEIFEHNGEWYQCVESDSCAKCSLFTTECKSGTKSDLADEVFGECSKARRTDNKHVIFKKLEKIGEPIIYMNKIFQRLKSLDDNICKYCYFRNQVCNPQLCGQVFFLVEIKKDIKDMGEENDIKPYDKYFSNGTVSNTDNLSKSNLKPFNFEATKAGKPVCTRDGRKARILCFDRLCCDEISTIVACVLSKDGKDENVIIYSFDGFMVDKQHPCADDLMMILERKEGWAKVRKDINLYDTKEEADRKMIGNDEYVTAKVCWEE